MAEFFMPVLSHFQNENPWSASAGRLRYWITPVVPRDEKKTPLWEKATLEVQVWEGPWERNLSTIEAAETFPLSEEGIAAIPDFLETWRQTVHARPERSLEENIARRKEPAVSESSE